MTETASKNVIDRRRVASHGVSWLIGLILGALGYRVAMPPVDQDADLVQLTSTSLDRVQEFWAAEMPGKWRDAKVVLLDSPISTPCGAADSSSGPFYCPRDHRVYLDLSFLRAIDGDLARAYVIGHELGHHVQRLLGSRLDGPALELQADCYAGRWMHSEVITGHAGPSDLTAVLAEAASVGDDRICPSCSPETWTHGSSTQRQAAVERGLSGLSCEAAR